MAFNAYLIFHKNARKNGQGDGIVGESSSDPEPGKTVAGAIEITDYGFGVTMPVATSVSDGGGQTVGRANFDVFTCSKNLDTATPMLVKWCCQGTNIPSIVLHIYRSGEGSGSGAIKYAMVVFQNCVITKVGITGGGEELPKESLEFSYGFCEYQYQKTKKTDGTPDGKLVTFGWSRVTNKQVDSRQGFGEFEPKDAAEKDK